MGTSEMGLCGQATSAEVAVTSLLEEIIKLRMVSSMPHTPVPLTSEEQTRSVSGVTGATVTDL